MVKVQAEGNHGCPAFRTFQRVISHGSKEKNPPLIKTQKKRLFCFWNSPVKRFVLIPVSGINAIITDHFKLLFGDMLYKQLNEFHGGNGFADKRIVFMPVVMKGNIAAVIGINSGQCDNRTSEITADILCYLRCIAKIRFCINIEPIFVFFVNGSLDPFKGGAEFSFHFIEQGSLESLTEIVVVKMFYSTPERVIRKSPFSQETVDVWIPFQWPSEGMEDTDKTRDKVF